MQVTVLKSINFELEALKFMAREEKIRVRKLEREKEDTKIDISEKKKSYEEIETNDMSENIKISIDTFTIGYLYI